MNTSTNMTTNLVKPFDNKSFAEDYVEDLSILDRYSVDEKIKISEKIDCFFTNLLIKGRHFGKLSGWSKNEKVYLLPEAHKFGFFRENRCSLGAKNYKTFVAGYANSDDDAHSDGDKGVVYEDYSDWWYVNTNSILTIHPVAFLLARQEAIMNSKRKGSGDTPLPACSSTGVHKVTFIYKGETSVEGTTAQYTATQISKWEDEVTISHKGKDKQVYQYVQSPVQEEEDFLVTNEKTTSVLIENLAGIILYKNNGEVVSKSLDASYMLNISAGLKKKSTQTPPQKPKKMSKKVNNPNYWETRLCLLP